MAEVKNRIQYVYSCTNAFFNYLKESDLDVLIKELKRIEAHAKDNIGGEGCTLWFRFGADYSLATDIRDIENDLNSNGSNKTFRLESFKRIIGLDPNDELRVFYS